MLAQSSNSNHQEPLLTIKEAAKLLGISPSTLRRWEEEGRIRPNRTANGSHRRYSQDDVKRLLRSFRVETDSRRAESANRTTEEEIAPYLDANGRLPPKIPIRTIEEVCRPFSRRKNLTHRLIDVALLLLLLIGAYTAATPVTQERIQRAFVGPLRNIAYSAVKIVSPETATALKPGILNPIVDINDVLEYTEMQASDDQTQIALRSKLTFIGSEIIAQTFRVAKESIFNTTQLLGNLFFGQEKRYVITAGGEATLRSLTLEESFTAKEIDTHSLTVNTLTTETLNADLDWDNIINRPSVVSSVDGVTNDEGNIDLVAGDNVSITSDDTENTITISATGGGGGGIETDPIFSASTVAGISSGDITNWNITYGWGDHTSAGYAADDDVLKKDGSVALTANWDAGGYEVRSNTFQSDVATGTAPLIIASSTLVTNLNADLLDGQHGSYYLNASNINAGTLGTDYFGAYADLTAEGYLDNDADTDLLTRTQSDGRYLSFRTISAPAGTNPVADLYNDTLTLAAGSNITITGAEGTDTVTFAVAGGVGSGLDADTLDGISSGSFLRSDTSDNYTSGTLTFDTSTGLSMAAGSTLDVSAATLTLADNQISWVKVNKTGSSLADLATRSILDTTGTLTVSRGGNRSDNTDRDAQGERNRSCFRRDRNGRLRRLLVR